MKSRNSKEGDSRSINLVLLAVSFIIFGVLGIVFITQMELQPGWAWESISDTYPIELSSFETEDINGNGNNEIISYANIRGTDDPEYYSTIQYGGIYCLEGSNGKPLWIREYNGPVKKLFQIMDIDGDGLRDYFVSKASISPNWTVQQYDNSTSYQPKILPNLYTNQLINGINGNDLSILTGDGINFNNFYVHDLVSLEDLSDQCEDLIMLECEATEIIEEDHTWFEYNTSLTSYFINGTKTKSIPLYIGDIREDYNVPGLELFEYYGNPQLLHINGRSLILFNISVSNFLEPIYNITFTEEIEDFLIIEDLNLDGISEILTSTWDGNISLIDGETGQELREFTIIEEDKNLEDIFPYIKLEEIHSAEMDGISYLLVNVEINYGGEENIQEKIMRVYTFDLTSEHVIWEIIKIGKNIEAETFVLNEDLNGDSVDEIIYHERYQPLISYSDVRRYTILSAIDGEELTILNTEYYADSIITKRDFDGDGKKDFVISGDDRVIALSSSKPSGLWLSSAFPLGLPLFIVLTILLVIGIIILILRGKRVSYRRHNIKEHKLTVAVNILAIVLMTITFLLFLILMNIFNNTLVTGSNNTNIVLVFLIVIIIWYGTLPLTAALYNRFAPQFAYVFIKLRKISFKISKGYKNDIIVLDLGEKKDIGIIIQLKRLILPLLLSIAVGFYAYDALTTWLNYPQEFEVFGSTEFFNFMMGYMLCCVLPMILSFLLFAFFISGNYLLDDAGIAYYRENKKYRQPGDIEPISIWAQSIVKGIAGLSALLTFGNFLGKVDFSGFFEIGEGNVIGIMFGIFIIIVMFVGIPFFTSFSYILLSGEIMEACAEENIKKLYEIMENNGYDTKPREITNIYPSGYESSNRETPLDMENPDTSPSE